MMGLNSAYFSAWIQRRINFRFYPNMARCNTWTYITWQCLLQYLCMSHLKLCFCLVVYSCVNVIDLIKVVWFIIKFYLIRLDPKLKPYFFLISNTGLCCELVSVKNIDFHLPQVKSIPLFKITVLRCVQKNIRVQIFSKYFQETQRAYSTFVKISFSNICKKKEKEIKLLV